MNSTAHDIGQYLAAQGLGTFGGTSGFGIYVSKEPTAPDDVITLYDTSGLVPDPENGVFAPAIQIRVRGNGFQAVYSKAEAVRDELINTTDITQGGTRYLELWQQGSIEQLGYDDNDRLILVMNFQTIRKAA